MTIQPPSDAAAWANLTSYDKSKLSVLIANVVNGPDTSPDDAWAKVINDTSNSGKTVIGYVRTGYFGLSNQNFTTRLGSRDLSDWIAQIEEDVDLWYRLYPNIKGIFFDEAWYECGESNLYSDLYRQISDSTKRKHQGAFTVLNPGRFMPQCFENSADTLLTFEGPYSDYINNYTGNGWNATDTRKIWHIIYEVAQNQIAEVAARSQERGAGYIEITNDGGLNPYDTLPDVNYMTTLLNAVSGGSVLVGEAGPRPNGTATSGPDSLTVTASDYTSASLSWPLVNGASEIQVRVSGGDYVSLPGDTTKVTIGNLTPGTNYTFTVVVLASDGTELPGTPSATATTTALPDGGKAVTNVKNATTATSTTYEADILFPYAFVRLFIWGGKLDCNLTAEHAWPINYNSAHYVCNQYMVEEKTLYQYTGKLDDVTHGATWSWSNMTDIVRTQTGHTYNWTLPLGNSTFDTNQFLIQVQGYGPRGNYLKPCPAGTDSLYALCA